MELKKLTFISIFRNLCGDKKLSDVITNVGVSRPIEDGNSQVDFKRREELDVDYIKTIQDKLRELETQKVTQKLTSSSQFMI